MGTRLIFVEDPKCGGYTAFFKHLPDILAEGATMKAAKRNLLNAVYDVNKYSKQNHK